MAAVEREQLETGVLFVGAGPATLSAAIRLVDLCRGRGIDRPFQSGALQFSITWQRLSTRYTTLPVRFWT